jgi:hypothetical protein
MKTGKELIDAMMNGYVPTREDAIRSLQRSVKSYTECIDRIIQEDEKAIKDDNNQFRTPTMMLYHNYFIVRRELDRLEAGGDLKH